MQTTNYYLGFRVILGLYRDSGKDDGNYCFGFGVIEVILGLHGDNGRENGNYYDGVI